MHRQLDLHPSLRMMNMVQSCIMHKNIQKLVEYVDIQSGYTENKNEYMYKKDEYYGKICNIIPRLVRGRCLQMDKTRKYEQIVDRISTLQYNNRKKRNIHERKCSLEDNHQKNGL